MINFFVIKYKVYFLVLLCIVFQDIACKSPKTPHSKGYYLVKLAGQNDNEYAGFIVEGANRVIPYSVLLASGIYCRNEKEIISNLQLLPAKSEIIFASSDSFRREDKMFLMKYSENQIASIKEKAAKFFHIRFL